MATAEFNIRSEKVQIFPATRRDYSKQGDARFFSEKNVTGITNKLLTKTNRASGLPYRNFVMTRDFITTADPIEFVIQGYYFKIDRIQDILDLFVGTQYDTIYAYIRLDNFNDLPEIAGQDVELEEVSQETGDTTYHYEYSGLYFSNSYNVQDEQYTVKLLVKEDGNTVKIPEDSFTVFDEYTLDVTTIDGGDIDQGQ